jgi:type IV pilus assembly protein PilA
MKTRHIIICLCAGLLAACSDDVGGDTGQTADPEVVAARQNPEYRAYIMRSKLAQAMQTMNMFKISVTEAYFDKGSLPGSNSAAGLKAPSAYKSDLVRSITVQKDSVIVMVLTDKIVDNARIALAPQVSGKRLIWYCRVSAEIKKYAPRGCR